MLSCVAILIFPAVVVCAPSENVLDGDSLAWSLQHDVIAFVSHDFQAILLSHGLEDAGKSDQAATTFSDPPSAEQIQLIKTNYRDIADSLLLMEPEVDRLYLQAYLCWLAIILGEDVSNQLLLNAETELNTKYGMHRTNILYRSRVSNYYGTNSGSMTVLLAAGGGDLIGPPGTLLNSYTALSCVVGVEIGRVGLEMSLQYSYGGLRVAVINSESRDYYGEEELPRPSFEVISTGLKSSYRLYDLGKFNLRALAGIRWYEVRADPPILTSLSIYTEPRSTKSVLFGFRIEYLLGETAKKHEESFMFGLIKVRGIQRYQFVPFAQVELARFDANSELVGKGSSLTFLFGIKIGIGGQTQRRDTNLNILDID